MVFVSVINVFRTTFECSSLNGPGDSGGEVGGHCHQKYGDVVTAAVAIGRGDQGFTRSGEGLGRRRLGNRREDCGDFFVFDLVDSYLDVPRTDLKALLRGPAKFVAREARQPFFSYRRAIERLLERSDAVTCASRPTMRVAVRASFAAHPARTPRRPPHAGRRSPPDPNS